MYLLLYFSEIADYYTTYEIVSYNKDKRALIKQFNEGSNVEGRYRLKEFLFDELEMHLRDGVQFTEVSKEGTLFSISRGYAIVELT